MNDRELMQMALDALEDADDILEAEGYMHGFQMEVIKAVKARLQELDPKPVAWLDSEGFPWSKEGIQWRSIEDTYQPLYTAPPKRDWVGLTEEEFFDLLHFDSRFDQVETPLLADFIRAVQSKLKEKNT
jgi:hypothetical protein